MSGQQFWEGGPGEVSAGPGEQYVTHDPQRAVKLGFQRSRWRDLWGGVMGSTVVTAILGRGSLAGEGQPGDDDGVETYALQPFTLPRRLSDPAHNQLAHTHTLLALEEAGYKTRMGGGKIGMPQQLREALSEGRTWRT